MTTSQILPMWWTPATLAAGQAKLLAQATSDDSAIQACTSVSTSFKSSWAAFFSQLKTFCTTQYGWLTTTNPDGSWDWGGGTGTTATQLQDYESALFQWEQSAKAASCALSAPSINPNTLPPATDALVTMVKYGSVAAAFLASAYVVGRVASTVSEFHTPGPYREDMRDRRKSMRSA